MTDKAALERQALRISVYGYLLLGALAVFFALKSQSEAILLDGFFNFVSFAMSIVTLRISSLLSIPYDRRFQYGFMPFEPFVNLIKGLIILVVCGFALVSSIDALIDGGRALSPGMAVIYSIIATSGCIIVFLVQKRYAARVDSPLLDLDLATWKVSGFISSAVAVGFGSAYLLSMTEYSWIVPYIDPVMVLILILVMIRMPLTAMKEGVADLLLGAPGREQQGAIRERISGTLAEYPMQRHEIRMVKVGRHIFVTVDVILHPETDRLSVAELDELRHRLSESVNSLHPVIEVDTIFTGRDRWAAGESSEGEHT
jgi:cation diffusion facilitator family transporter